VEYYRFILFAKGVTMYMAQQPSPYHYKGLDCRAYLHLGCHKLSEHDFVFRVWAPNARSVSVVGDFNNWDPRRDPMTRRQDGVWEATVGKVNEYDAYKFWVCTHDGTELMKADPYGAHSETRPDTASKVYTSDYERGDQKGNDDKNKRAI